MASSISLMSSRFITGLPSPLRQPLRFQPGIHFVTVLITYWLSHKICRSSSTCAVARNSSSTAFSSPMLLVPCRQPPAAHVLSSMYQAQPAGPGLPRAEPSAEAVIVIASRLAAGAGAPDRLANMTTSRVAAIVFRLLFAALSLAALFTQLFAVTVPY